MNGYPNDNKKPNFDEEEIEFDHAHCAQVPREACYWCRREAETKAPYLKNVAEEKRAELIGDIRI